MAIAPIPIPGVAGVPVLRDGQQAGIAPTGYAPGTVVQMLGQQLMQPPAPVAVPVPVPAQVFAPMVDDTGFGEQDTSVADAQASGTGNIAADLGLPSELTDPIADLGLGFANPTPMGLGLSALGAAVPALAPVGLAYSLANALGNVVGPTQTNALGQTQQFGFGNQNIDAFGNPVGSPENIASIMSFDPDRGFVDQRGQPMSPTISPEVMGEVAAVGAPTAIGALGDIGVSVDNTATAQSPMGAVDTDIGFGPASSDLGTVDTDIAFGPSDDAGGDGEKVICGEMHRQGRISTPIYLADQEFGQHIREQDPYVMDGYLAWANKVVSLMQKSCAFSWFVALFAKPWAREMYRRETGRGRGSLAGKVMMKVGIPLCRFIGKRNARGWLPPFRSHKHA